MRLSISRVVLALTLPLAWCPPVQVEASQVAGQWYFGSWSCRIDGRPSRMQWGVADDPQTQCEGNVCSTTSGVRVFGRFSDNGSRWVPLTVRWTRGNELGIRYAGVDNWYLRHDPARRTASGWTSWNGSRYRLECQKTR